nr:ATP-binding protein [Motilibacter aurantiacus]
MGRQSLLEGHAFAVPPGAPHASVDLRPEPRAAREARLWVRSQVPPLGPEAADALDILVSEVVTNAVLHARTRFTVGVTRLDSAVLVTVADHNPQQPEPQAESDSRTSGRGLALLSALSDDWGVTTEPDGKCVWFVLAAAGPRGATR